MKYKRYQIEIIEGYMMLFEYPKGKWNEISGLFDNHKYYEALVKGTFNERFGTIYVNDLKNPSCAVLLYKMIVAFGGSGECINIKEFFSLVPERAYLLCPNEKWITAVRNHFGERLTIINRTKVSSAKLNLDHFRKLKENIPEGYQIVQLTEELVDSFEGKFLQRYSYFYDTLEIFKKKGFGFCAIYRGEIVSVAASILPYYNSLFEVQIDTLPEHQRKGLATIVCTHLLEYSLENGFDPQWDAFTPISTALALKLGYTHPEPYQLLTLE
ncbi:MAG: GNAT family N-acetyltransferase [Candidatus Thorarchaeota archaeon]